MNFKIDYKSFSMGCLMMLGMGLLISSQYPQTESPVGRFQATSSEIGFLILDTQSGEFIFESDVNYIGNNRMMRGDFTSNFQTGKNIITKKAE
ncbi:MAG: hypothetical protein SH808_05590 [Saprospiraceae bacterium]|nr:hypothetical protein [Saprospiraceae bacterium]